MPDTQNVVKNPWLIYSMIIGQKEEPIYVILMNGDIVKLATENLYLYPSICAALYLDLQWVVVNILKTWLFKALRIRDYKCSAVDGLSLSAASTQV